MKRWEGKTGKALPKWFTGKTIGLSLLFICSQVIDFQLFTAKTKDGSFSTSSVKSFAFLQEVEMAEPQPSNHLNQLNHPTSRFCF